MSDNNTSGTLLVGEGVFMRGTIKVPGVATIDGKIEGIITADTIFVTGNGAIAGTTTANHIRVGGTLTDTTVANKTLVIESAGLVAGDITYAELEIKRGGSLQGQILKVRQAGSSGYQPYAAAPAAEPPAASEEGPII